MNTIKEHCEWDPSKHNGKPCPWHSPGGIVDQVKKGRAKYADIPIEQYKEKPRTPRKQEVEEAIASGKPFSEWEDRTQEYWIDMNFNEPIFEEYLEKVPKDSYIGSLFESDTHRVEYDLLDVAGADYFVYNKNIDKYLAVDLKTKPANGNLDLSLGQILSFFHGSNITKYFLINSINKPDFNNEYIYDNLEKAKESVRSCRFMLVHAKKIYDTFVTPINDFQNEETLKSYKKLVFNDNTPNDKREQLLQQFGFQYNQDNHTYTKVLSYGSGQKVQFTSFANNKGTWQIPSLIIPIGPFIQYGNNGSKLEILNIV